jgi:hypothetical protein
MISPKEMRALALALPDAVELPHFDRASFRVRGKIFATLASDGTAMLKLDLDTHEALLAGHPEAFFSFGGWSRSGATGVTLARVPRALFRELLEQAFRGVSAQPKRRARPR